jgi:Histidine kinase
MNTMHINRKKVLTTIGLWLIPFFLVLLLSLVFIPRTPWKSFNLYYYLTFWSVRALLSPFIVYYTFRFWVELNRIGRLLFIHFTGFLLFSICFWTICFLLLHKAIEENGIFGSSVSSTSLNIYSVIADNSVSVNVVVYISTVVICYLWDSVKRTVIANKKSAELEKTLLISRHELLKSQINAHFLFNTLHTISSLVVRKQNDEANKMIINLSYLLRFSLNGNKDQLITLEKEVEFTKVYVEIQKTRFKERLIVDFLFSDDINDALVPPMILQPLIENAVKYAVEPYPGVGTITINIKRKNNRLSVTITDNGKAPFNSINFDSGIGLNNTKERLKQLFNEDYIFSISPGLSHEGVTIYLEIPFQKQKHAANESAYS